MAKKDTAGIYSKADLKQIGSWGDHGWYYIQPKDVIKLNKEGKHEIYIHDLNDDSEFAIGEITDEEIQKQIDYDSRAFFVEDGKIKGYNHPEIKYEEVEEDDDEMATGGKVGEAKSIYKDLVSLNNHDTLDDTDKELINTTVSFLKENDADNDLITSFRPLSNYDTLDKTDHEIIDGAIAFVQKIRDMKNDEMATGGKVKKGKKEKKYIDALYDTANMVFKGHIGNNGKMDYSEKEYGYLLDEIEDVEVGYYKKGFDEVDSSYAEELREKGFSMTQKEAEDTLLHRLESIKEEGIEFEIPAKKKFKNGGKVKDEKQMVAEVRYTDGTNWKTEYIFVIPEEAIDTLEVGDEVSVNKFGITDDQWFYGEYLPEDYNEEYDHNLVEVLEIREKNEGDIISNEPRYKNGGDVKASFGNFFSKFGALFGGSYFSSGKKMEDGGDVIDGVKGRYVKGDSIDYHKLEKVKSGSPLGGEYFIEGKYGYAQSGYDWFKFYISDLKNKMANGGDVEGDPKKIKKRLEYLRKELRAERISMGELSELQSLSKHIDPSDVELLEAAGVPEFPADKKIVFDEVNNRVVSEDDSVNVFYTDKLTCPNTIIEEVVSLYNDGKSSEIDEYLLDEEKCTQDDREVIVEGIYSFDNKMAKGGSVKSKIKKGDVVEVVDKKDPLYGATGKVVKFFDEGASAQIKLISLPENFKNTGNFNIGDFEEFRIKHIQVSGSKKENVGDIDRGDFGKDTDKWFGGLADLSSDMKEDPDTKKLLSITTKEATKENLEKFRAIVEPCECPKPELKKAILKQIDNILDGKYKKEFRLNFGGKAGDVRKVSATSSFFSQFRQAATYNH